MEVLQRIRYSRDSLHTNSQGEKEKQKPIPIYYFTKVLLVNVNVIHKTGNVIHKTFSHENKGSGLDALSAHF